MTVLFFVVWGKILIEWLVATKKAKVISLGFSGLIGKKSCCKYCNKEKTSCNKPNNYSF
jgi:hypothetical protein